MIPAEGGAELLVNISASPFHVGKAEEREEMLATRARDNGVPLVFCNAVGGQDELLFDELLWVEHAQQEHARGDHPPYAALGHRTSSSAIAPTRAPSLTPASIRPVIWPCADQRSVTVSGARGHPPLTPGLRAGRPAANRRRRRRAQSSSSGRVVLRVET